MFTLQDCPLLNILESIFVFIWQPGAGVYMKRIPNNEVNYDIYAGLQVSACDYFSNHVV